MKILNDVFDRELIEDIKNLKYDEVFEKYNDIYHSFYQTDFGEWEAVCGGYRQWVDDNFMRLDFKPIWGDVVNVLRTRMALRVVMKPTIDINGLLFNAYVDFHTLVKKKEWVFPIGQLKEAVLEVRQLTMSDIKFKYRNEIEKAKSERPKSGYICKDVHSSVVRKYDIDNAIRFYYNPNIDLKDNLDNLKRNGVDITKTRLLQYLDEFGEGKKKENEGTRKMPVTYPDKLKTINVNVKAVLSLLKILTKRVEMTSKEPFVEGTIFAIKMVTDKVNEIKNLCIEKEPPEKKVKKVKEKKEEEVFPVQDLPSIGARRPTIIEEIPSIDTPYIEEEDMHNELWYTRSDGRLVINYELCKTMDLFKGKNKHAIVSIIRGIRNEKNFLAVYNPKISIERNLAMMENIGMRTISKNTAILILKRNNIEYTTDKEVKLKLLTDLFKENPKMSPDEMEKYILAKGYSMSKNSIAYYMKELNLRVIE